MVISHTLFLPNQNSIDIDNLSDSRMAVAKSQLAVGYEAHCDAGINLKIQCKYSHTSIECSFSYKLVVD